MFAIVFGCVISLQEALENLLKISPESMQNRCRRRLGGIESGVFVRDICQVAKKGGRFTSTRAQGGVSRSNRITTFFQN